MRQIQRKRVSFSGKRVPFSNKKGNRAQLHRDMLKEECKASTHNLTLPNYLSPDEFSGVLPLRYYY
jgi:hypothetical protein